MEPTNSPTRNNQVNRDERLDGSKRRAVGMRCNEKRANPFLNNFEWRRFCLIHVYGAWLVCALIYADWLSPFSIFVLKTGTTGIVIHSGSDIFRFNSLFDRWKSDRRPWCYSEDAYVYRSICILVQPESQSRSNVIILVILTLIWCVSNYSKGKIAVLAIAFVSFVIMLIIFHIFGKRGGILGAFVSAMFVGVAFFWRKNK